MKKLLLAIAFVFVCQFTFAQADTDFKKDVMKVLMVNGSGAQMQSAKSQIIKMIPPAKQAGFILEFDAMMPKFYDKMADAYMETYTHDDIKEMLKFYDTPIGRKINAKSGELMDKSSDSMSGMQQDLQAMVMKYMQ